MNALHPVAELFPPLTEEEREALRASIRESGVLVPAVVDADGLIVDGRHRHEIAAELGLPCPTERLPDDVTPWQFAAGVNLARRNLTEQQRVALLLLAEQAGAAPEVAKIRKEAKRRERAGKPSALENGGSGETSDQIGALVEVSGATVRRVQTAEKVQAGALKQIANGEATAQQILNAATQKAVSQIEQAAGTPAAFKKWREAFKAIDGNVSGEAISANAHQLTAGEIDLVRNATPRLIASLQSFLGEVTRTAAEISVIQGGRR